VFGCCVAETIEKAYRVIPNSFTASQEAFVAPVARSVQAEPATIGISRIWVASDKRRNGIATRLLDAVRYDNFVLENLTVSQK